MSVEQLLDVSRVEAGKLALDRHVVDLAELVRSAAATAQSGTREHSLIVRAPSSLEALVDSLRIEQVLANLLGNAIRYSPDGGELEIELQALDNGTAQITVVDHGIGIPPEQRDYIFDRFHQAHGDIHYGGMGLGLYISQEIIERHGGAIRPKFPDAGVVRFVVTLPRGDRGPNGVNGVRVLVIDDDPAIRDLIKSALTLFGYQVAVATDGAEGLERAAEWQPALILLDMRMPVLDGWEFARIYRERPGEKSPILVVTAATDAAASAAEIEAAGFLAKPFHINDLLDRVAEHVNREA